MDEQNREGLPKPWEEDQAILIWQHFANIGGSDKDRMVVVATWLLGFSGAIIGIVTQELGKQGFNNPLAASILAFLGILVSLLATAVITIYASYSNWNWGMADAVAKLYEWHDLYPNPNEKNNICFKDEKKRPVLSTFELQKAEADDFLARVKASNRQARKVLQPLFFENLFKRGRISAKPKSPHREWAPIFVWFLSLAQLSCLAHIVILFGSLFSG